MTSWRDSASPQAQGDLDNALSAGIGAAQDELAAHGGFYPFSVVVRTDGTTELVSALPSDGDDAPQAAELVRSLDSAVADLLPDLRAVAVLSDVAVPDGEAIQVTLEHAEGQAIAVQLPYSRSPTGKVTFGDLRATGGERRHWH